MVPLWGTSYLCVCPLSSLALHIPGPFPPVHMHGKLLTNLQDPLQTTKTDIANPQHRTRNTESEPLLSTSNPPPAPGARAWQNDRVLGTDIQQGIIHSCARKLRCGEEVQALSLVTCQRGLELRSTLPHLREGRGVKSKSPFRASSRVWQGTRHLSLQHYAPG